MGGVGPAGAKRRELWTTLTAPPSRRHRRACPPRAGRDDDDYDCGALDVPRTYGVDDLPVLVQDEYFTDEGQLDIGAPVTPLACSATPWS